MKIPSIYSQNYIASKTTPVRKSTDVQKPQEAQPAKKISQPKETNSLKFSEVADRVLSTSEKVAILTNFGDREGKSIKAYTASGKTVNMDVMIGRKIDVRG